MCKKYAYKSYSYCKFYQKQYKKEYYSSAPLNVQRGKWDKWREGEMCCVYSNLKFVAYCNIIIIEDISNRI